MRKKIIFTILSAALAGFFVQQGYAKENEKTLNDEEMEKVVGN